MLRIRYFEPKDTQDVAAVILPIQQDEFDIAVTLEAQPDLGNIPKFYQQGCGNFWVAEHGNRIAGAIGQLGTADKFLAAAASWIAGGGSGCSAFIEYPSAAEKMAWAGPCESGMARGVGISR